MAGGEPGEAGGSHVVVGVDGSGRTRRLGRLAAAQEGPVVRLQATASGAELADLLAGSAPSVQAAASDSPAPPWPGAVPGGRVLVVDDAHRLSADAVQVLLAAVRGGDRLLLARRPTPGPGVAELEVAADAAVELLAPLDRAAVASLLSAATGHAAPAELAAAVLTASAGWPALAVPLARAAAEPRQGPVDGPPPAVLARVQRALALAGPDAAAVARVLALDPDLPDAELGRAVDWPGSPAADPPDPSGRVPAAVRALRDAGLLTPGSERLVPMAAAAVRREQTAVERRAGQRRIVEAWRASGSGPLPLARASRAAGLTDGPALDAYLAAAEALRDNDPGAAEQWLDRLDGDPTADPDRSLRVAALRAELDLLLGRDRLPDPTAAGIVGDRTLSASPLSHDPGTPGAAAESAGRRLALAAAVADVRRGHPARGGAALVRCGPTGAALAVPALLAAGRLDLARTALVGAADITADDEAADRPPVAVSRLAEAVLDAVDRGPEAALPGLLDAVETADLTARGGAAGPLWPETPHALTALIAIAAGDLPVAEHALAEPVLAGRVPAGPSPAAGPGPGALRRHRLLLAWARLRAGRYDTAVELLRDPAVRAGDDGEPVRDRQLRLVLEAGLARRRGDVAAMRALWPRVEPLLARRSVDLFALEPLEELVVVAARLRRPERVDPVLDDVDTVVSGLGAWRATAGWLRLQVAVALDDADRAAAAVAAIGSPRSGRAAVLADAARCWAAVLADTVAADEVLAAVDGLAGPAAMPWEASQLAGQAAIRSTDPRLARRLLERARELSHAESAAPPDPSDGRVGGLSEREVEVSRLVLAGRTHKEIGSQLYISAKTVEHHVARIRTKLGVQTRAEFVAALRALLAEGVAEEIGAARIPPPSPDS